VDISLLIKQERDQPLYKTFTEAFIEAIQSGRLSPGQALPSVRALAASYGVSPDTAVRCYAELAAQGFIETIPKTGTFVRNASLSNQSSRQAVTPVEPLLSQYAKRLLHAAEDLALSQAEATPTLTATDHLPTSTWQKLLSKHRNSLGKDLSLLNYGARPAGIEPLREAIASYLARVRGVRCEPRQVLVTSGSRLDLICRLLIDPRDKVVIENPCYPTVYPLLLSHAAVLHPTDSDDDGMIVEGLSAIKDEVKLVYVTPSHQDPTGAVLSENRRRKLLAWAAERKSFIWESDVDHQFRYGSAPAPSLQALDTNDSVVYSGSFWPVLGPLAKVGYIVVPLNLLPVVMQMQDIFSRDVSVIEQYALTDFILDGHLERHVLQLKKTYTRKRQALIHALTTTFADSIRLAKAGSGFHVLVKFLRATSSEAVAHAAAESQLPFKSSAPYYFGDAPECEFLIPFSVLDEDRLQESIRELAHRLNHTA
jgi:GntR family transcriptional regulator/MocR family aminotransferase